MLPIASAFALFIRLRGRLWICIQKEAVSKLASSTDSVAVSLQRPIRYLSKDHGPWDRIFCASASSVNSSNTVFAVRSRISKSFTNLHILFRVRDKASMLTRRFVKSFATRDLLLSSTSDVKEMV